MLSIGEFSKTASITTNTLRYYDEIGLLKPAFVDEWSGYRYYEVSQLEDIMLINRLKLYGFSLLEIGQVLITKESTSQSAQVLLALMRQKQTELERNIVNASRVLKELQGDMANLERGKRIMGFLEDMQIELVETERMNVLSIRENMNVYESGKYIGTLCKKIAEEKLTAIGAPMFIYHSDEYTPDNYDVEVAIPVAESVEGTRIFEAFLCARITHVGEYTQLPQAYAKLGEWVQKEGYTIAGAVFDKYITDPSVTAPDQNITEIYFPVNK